MEEARTILGQGRIYVTFDIDNPSFAPGTGTPEIVRFSTQETQKMICSLTGLNLFGADLVEVSPPFDPSVEQPGSTRLRCPNCCTFLPKTQNSSVVMTGRREI